MRRALLFCAAIVLAIACGDNITEPIPDRKPVTPPVSFATTTTEDGLSISTDKDDYAPGDTVHFTGSGWPANDVLDVVLVDDLQKTHTWTINTAEDGTFQDSTYVIDQADLGATFTLTATSTATGRSLTVTFTDGNIKIAASPSGVQFILKATQFSTTNCTGTGTDQADRTVDDKGTTYGAGNTESLRLEAAAASSSGGAFLGWAPSSASSPYTPIGSAVAPASTSRTICVPGFQGGGTRDYSANYTAVPDLTITKTASPNTFTVGSAASYSLAVKNIGQIATSGTVTVTDEIPSGLTVGTITAPNWTCTGTNSLSCTRSNALAVNASYDNIVVAVTPTVSAAPSVTNTALVSGGGDVSAGNNGSTITTPVSAFVDLTIDKGHTGNFTRGSNGTYTLTVTNAGTAATNADITVSDPLPNGLSFVSGTGTDWSCVSAMGGKTANCTRPAANSIAIGASAPPITLTVSVATNTNASITNTASVSGGGEPAANDGNNSDSDPTTVVDPVVTPTKLAFTTAAFSRTTNVCSPQITVQTQNASNAPTNPTANTTVNLTSSSAGGAFFSNSGCTTGISSVVIQTTGNTASFFYKDGTVGTPTLTAAATGLTPGTQQETITAAPNAAPVVDAGGPYSGNEGSAIALNQATATDPDAGDTPIYKWTYVAAGTVDAGTSCSFSNDAILQPTFTCNDDGTFTVTLTVDDAHGHVVPDNGTVTVINVKPVATAGGPYSGNEGAAIQLSGAGDDPGNNDDDPNLTYLWTINTTGIDAGGSCSFDDATKKNAKVTCTDDSNAGTFTLTLVATDDDGASSTGSNATLTVVNVKPVADAGGGTSGYSGAEGSAIQLNGSADDPGNNDDAGLTYHWTADVTGIDLGGACTFDDATKKDAKLTCTDNGAFKVKLVATDDDGASSTESVADLNVSNVDPVANAGGGTNGYSGNEGAAIQLHGSATDAGSNDTFTWAWVYTAGPGALDPGASCSFSSPTAKEPTVTCTDDGTVKLTLTVTDDNGGSDTDDATLTLANVDPVAEAGGGTNGYSGNEGSAIQLYGSATDAGSNDTFSWSWAYTAGDGFINGATCSFDVATAKQPKITCNDNGTVKLTLTVTDDDGGSDTDDATLTVLNVDPVAEAGGGATSTYSGDEGSAIQLHGSATDAGSNDTFTWGWAYTAGPGALDAGANCSFSSATAKEPTVTCTDDGTVKLTLTVTDDDGGSDTDDATLTVANANPVANAGGPYSGNEGAAISLTGSKTDAGSNDTHTYLWTYAAVSGVDAGATCSFSNATALNTTINCTDDGSYKVTLQVTDDDGGVGTNDANLTLSNVAPVVTVSAPVDYSVWNINGIAGVSNFVNSSFTDVGKNDTHTCSINWGDGDPEVPGVVTETANSGLGTCTLTPSSNPYPDDGAGIYTLTVTVRDDDAGASSVSRTLVVYDPSAGFVTGGGWFNSPLGACQMVGCTTATGRANFGFVSKYLKATSATPSGNTEFQFQAGNLNFHSESYEWLLVNQSGTNAQYKGSGSINGVGGYKFMLWAADGSYDTFRIRIWQEVGGSEIVAYDNMGSGSGGFSTVPIGGGSIVIQTNRVASK